VLFCCTFRDGPGGASPLIGATAEEIGMTAVPTDYCPDGATEEFDDD
jgi:hypothetical protein